MRRKRLEFSLKRQGSLVMDITGTINQHGKITISLRIGNVATLKGDLDETGTDTIGIVCAADSLSSDGGRQPCG